MTSGVVLSGDRRLIRGRLGHRVEVCRVVFPALAQPVDRTHTMIASFYCLAEALKTIPVGTGYAVWTGIGAAGTALPGMLPFAESTAAPRLISLCLIVLGIVGLKLHS